MGASKGNKCKKGQDEPGTRGGAPRLLGQNMPAAAPDDAKACSSNPKSYMDDLTPEQRVAEERKREERQRKAKESQQRQLQENARKEFWAKEQQKKERELERQSRDWQRILDSKKQRAFREGVLESKDYGEGWYVQLGKELYQQVQDIYYCTLCGKHLNDNTLMSHIDSDGHKKKVLWNSPAPDAAPSTGAPATAPVPAQAVPMAVPEQPSAPAFGPGPLEAWQEDAQCGYRRCIPCQKIIDGPHLWSEDHQNRLARWQEAEERKRQGYPTPELRHLAYVPFYESDTSDKSLKCLLCDKWVQDAWSHSGTFDDPFGSKEHQKNLRNYHPEHPWWKERVQRLRDVYHPSHAHDDAPRFQADGAASLSPNGETGPVMPPMPSHELPPGMSGMYSDEDSRRPLYDGKDSPQEVQEPQVEWC